MNAPSLCRVAGLCVVVFAGAARGQSDTTQVLKLRAELASMRATLADLKLQIQELKEENRRLKARPEPKSTPVPTPKTPDATAPEPADTPDASKTEPTESDETPLSAAAVFYFTESKIQHGLELSLINKTIDNLNAKGKAIAKQKDLPLAVKKAEVDRINAEIVKLQKRRRVLVAPNYFYQPVLLNIRKVGTVGHPRGPIKIIQILDGSTCLISILNQGRAQEVWLKEMDTNGLRAGQDWQLPDPVEVTGSKTYQSALGVRRTALVWKRFDPSRYTPRQIRSIMDAGPDRPAGPAPR